MRRVAFRFGNCNKLRNQTRAKQNSVRTRLPDHTPTNTNTKGSLVSSEHPISILTAFVPRRFVSVRAGRGIRPRQAIGIGCPRKTKLANLTVPLIVTQDQPRHHPADQPRTTRHRERNPGTVEGSLAIREAGVPFSKSRSASLACCSVTHAPAKQPIPPSAKAPPPAKMPLASPGGVAFSG